MHTPGGREEMTTENLCPFCGCEYTRRKVSKVLEVSECRNCEGNDGLFDLDDCPEIDLVDTDFVFEES